MPAQRQGSIHLFRLAGINIFLHWSWFLVAAFEIMDRRGSYSNVAWNALEYLALFAIVLTHEFGHALACRSVGGQANQILLWPFGGVAYVNPPQRPGAMLWSIAAGPLVNVALAPILYAALYAARAAGLHSSSPDAYHFLVSVLYIDIGLLLFNILPVYPLDGGQILRSLLWFPFGRGRSLLFATAFGFLGVAGFIAFAVYTRSVWLGAIALYMGMNCWASFRAALAIRQMEKLPRRPGFACPSCRTAPPIGPFWQCGQCTQHFDTFETGSVCPYCGARYATTMCLDCQEQSPIAAWAKGDHAWTSQPTYIPPPSENQPTL